MCNNLISIFYLYVIYQCVIMSLIVLDHLVFNYILLLDMLIKKILVYPTIIFISFTFGIALVFTYKVVKLILQDSNIRAISSG